MRAFTCEIIRQKGRIRTSLVQSCQPASCLLCERYFGKCGFGRTTGSGQSCRPPQVERAAANTLLKPCRSAYANPVHWLRGGLDFRDGCVRVRPL